MRCTTMAAAALAVVGMTLSQSAQALNLLAPGDFIIAVNVDQDGSRSNPAGAEPAGDAVDGLLDKYLNFARDSSGLIVTPASGPSVVQSLVLTTANDWENRDPASYVLYGTNDPISSVDKSPGGAEKWTLISSGTLALPSARDTVADPIDFANAASYTSYRLSFPTLKNAPDGNPNSMQIAEVQLFTGAGGTGTDVLNAGDPAISIANSYPFAESPSTLLDGNTATKFLTFGKENTGVIVTPGVGPSKLNRFTFNLAGDSEGFSGRDPASFEIYGTNDPIVSVDDSRGDFENWTLLNSGTLTYDPANEGLVGPIHVGSTDFYTSYKIVFPTLRGTLDGSLVTNSMQISELQLIGSVPEPSTVALVGLGLVGLVACRRFARR